MIVIHPGTIESGRVTSGRIFPSAASILLSSMRGPRTGWFLNLVSWLPQFRPMASDIGLMGDPNRFETIAWDGLQFGPVEIDRREVLSRHGVPFRCQQASMHGSDGSRRLNKLLHVQRIVPHRASDVGRVKKHVGLTRCA
jgi:hypothetical protein